MSDESMEGVARNDPRCAECTARPFDAKNPHTWKDYPSTEYDDYANAKHEAWDDGAIVGFAAGRAAERAATDEALRREFGRNVAVRNEERMSDEREADIATLTIDYLQAEIREVALDVLTDYSPEDPPSDADIAYAQRQADAIASRWAMHRDATFADETLRVPASSEPRPEVRDCPLMHGAAPCPMCAYCPHGLTAGRGADERCLECGAAVTEPRPENPYRTVHARMSPPGAAWDEGFASRQPEIDRLEAERDEARLETWRIVHKCPSCDRYFDSPSICSDGTYTVEQLERVPDGTWPDQSAQHGVLLDQIKDAYAEGIADTLDRLRVRAAEMLPEVARFTLDEIEVAAADLLASSTAEKLASPRKHSASASDPMPLCDCEFCARPLRDHDEEESG